MFVDPAEREGAAYAGSGRRCAGASRRSPSTAASARVGARSGYRRATIRFSERNGKPYGVFKCATDITERKLRNADHAGKLDALDRSQGIIEFELDGTIVTANANFLAVVGYGLDEVKGQAPLDVRRSGGTRQRRLPRLLGGARSRRYQQAEYRRIGKGGREAWIQATYNPFATPRTAS